MDIPARTAASRAAPWPAALADRLVAFVSCRGRPALAIAVRGDAVAAPGETAACIVGPESAPVETDEPENAVSEAAVPEAIAPEAAAPGIAVSEALLSKAVASDAIASKALAPEATASSNRVATCRRATARSRPPRMIRAGQTPSITT
ncbi:hypothetical protein [Bordetella genomosp. 10]|uniref:hypothetical protein n=1 Tax=Bordetella genomosp. 10 TaxID=1416804 RepID=UPI00211AC6E3|nr:hypothetical protein [Bordetella genomosp. 10]